jgi:hypothetical protein
MDHISQPTMDAEKATAERKKTRESMQIENRSFLALEIIADELTRLHADARTIRYLFATYAARP